VERTPIDGRILGQTGRLSNASFDPGKNWLTAPPPVCYAGVAGIGWKETSMARRRKSGEFFEILDKMSKKKSTGRQTAAANDEDAPLESYDLRGWSKPLRPKQATVAAEKPKRTTPRIAPPPAVERPGEPETMTFRRGTIVFTGVAVVLLMTLAYMLGSQRGSRRRTLVPPELTVKDSSRRAAGPVAKTGQAWGVLVVSYKNTPQNQQRALNERRFLLQHLALNEYQVRAMPHGQLVTVYIGSFASKSEATTMLQRVQDLGPERGYPFRRTAYIIDLIK